MEFSQCQNSELECQTAILSRLQIQTNILREILQELRELRSEQTQ